MIRSMRSLVLVAVGLGGLVLAGCGPGGSTVSGEVQAGSVKLNPGDKIVINLSGTQSYSGEATEGGKFSIPNVQPGKYKVSVIHYVAAPAQPKPGTPPQGGGSYNFAPKDYPDEWTVPGGPYTLDLSKLKK